MKIIAGGTSSLLYDELVNKKKIFYGSGFYQGLSREGYIFFMQFQIKKLNPKIDKLIMEQIRILVKNELSSERLETEKKNIFTIVYIEWMEYLNHQKFMGKLLQ